jgi:hypothetical protein
MPAVPTIPAAITALVVVMVGICVVVARWVRWYAWWLRPFALPLRWPRGLSGQRGWPVGGGGGCCVAGVLCCPWCVSRACRVVPTRACRCCAHLGVLCACCVVPTSLVFLSGACQCCVPGRPGSCRGAYLALFPFFVLSFVFFPPFFPPLPPFDFMAPSPASLLSFPSPSSSLFFLAGRFARLLAFLSALDRFRLVTGGEGRVSPLRVVEALERVVGMVGGVGGRWEGGGKVERASEPNWARVIENRRFP